MAFWSFTIETIFPFFEFPYFACLDEEVEPVVDAEVAEDGALDGGHAQVAARVVVGVVQVGLDGGSQATLGFS